MSRKYSIRSGRSVVRSPKWGRFKWNPRLVLRVAGGVLAAAAICLVFFLAKEWLYDTDLFRLTRVEIHGNRHVNQDMILKTCNLRAGINLLSLDTDQLQGNIESMDWVRTARVVRELPDKLVINIKEYRPVALVNGNGLYLVNINGKIFKKLRGDEHYDLPIITGVDPRDVESGELPKYAMSALRLIKMASNGARTLGTGNISEIHVSGGNRLVVYTLDRGIAMRMDASKLKQQFARAEKVLLHLYRSGLYKKAAKVDLAYSEGTAWASVN